jgi:DNA-binding transcriptional ArsR family regulator
MSASSCQMVEQSLDEVIAALIGAPRGEIVECLVPGPLGVSSIAELLQLDIGTISHHLAILKRHRLVHMQKVGLKHIYQLSEFVEARIKNERLRVRIRCAGGEGAVLIRQVQI